MYLIITRIADGIANGKRKAINLSDQTLYQETIQFFGKYAAYAHFLYWHLSRERELQ